MSENIVKFFTSPLDFRKWLEKHHDTSRELWVGFYKKSSGKPSISWPESVDVALCFGWIDGLRKSIDESSYRIRFTPRKPDSTWSAVNIQRVAQLTKQGRMHKSGLKVFGERDPAKSDRYSYEQRNQMRLSKKYEKQFRVKKNVWNFFRSQAPSYQRMMTFWIMSAKREETQQSRLNVLIDYCKKGERIPVMKPANKGKK